MKQTSRQWMVTHEWMVKPMRQTEWIEGEGVLIWLSEVFSSLGTGLYIVALFFNNWWAALLGYFIVVGIKMPLHFIYLGKPFRFWRALPPFTRAWRTSWIARGFFFTTLFAGVGLIQLILGYYMTFMSEPTTGVTSLILINFLVKVVAGILIVFTAVYCGFMMSFCKSVPFWNTGLLPIVIMNAGVADGLALLLGVGMVSGGVDIMTVEAITRFLLLANIILIGTYLINSEYRSATAKLSSSELLTGNVAGTFWGAVVILGIFVPLVISVAGYFTAVPHTVMIIAIIAHTAGAFGLKYCILKVGIYKPILPKLKTH